MTIDELHGVRAILAGTPKVDPAQVAVERKRFMSVVVRTTVPRIEPQRWVSRTPRRLGLVAAAVLTLAVAAGAAAATGLLSSEPAVSVDQSKSLGEVDNVFDMSIFESPSPVQFENSGDRAAITKVIEGTGNESISKTLDLSMARSVAIPDSRLHMWLIPNHKDELCVFTPSNGAFNSGCTDVQTVKKTGIVGISAGLGDEKVLAYEIAPDDAAGLTIKSTDGSSREVPLERNAAVTYVKKSDVVTNGVVTYNVGKLVGREPLG